MKVLVLTTIFISLTGFCAIAEEQEIKAKNELPVPELQVFSTEHSGTFAGKKLSYLAEVSNIHIKNDKDEVIADVVTTDYLMKNSAIGRPVTFVFNGGPGSSSVWLHLGLLGPKRVDVPSDAKDPGNAPFRLVDNVNSPLGVTDLVFIDPVGTGFSVLSGKGTGEDVWGLKEDARLVSEVIHQWVRKHNRWNSPKYIVGESFGTTRAAAMLPYLDGEVAAVRLNGLILISQALDYQGSTPDANNMLAFVTYLPTMVATAWYHGKIDKQAISLEALMAQVRSFASDEYLPALFKGSSLPKDEFEAIASKLATFLGLDIDYVKDSNLRIIAWRYLKQLMRNEGMSVGRLDARYTASEIDKLSLEPDFDAASAATSAAYTAALNDYLVRDLKVTWDRVYKIGASEDLDEGWVWDRELSKGGEPKYVNSAPQLAMEMSKNPSFKVFVANGYYDFATPFFDAEYTFHRHGIDMSRVTMKYYEGGHMMYLHTPSLEKVAADIRNFISEK
jgi:carboxypeptidase C (cathepsin A)